MLRNYVRVCAMAFPAPEIRSGVVKEQDPGKRKQNETSHFLAVDCSLKTLAGSECMESFCFLLRVSGLNIRLKTHL